MFDFFSASEYLSDRRLGHFFSSYWSSSFSACNSCFGLNWLDGDYWISWALFFLKSGFYVGSWIYRDYFNTSLLCWNSLDRFDLLDVVDRASWSKNDFSMKLWNCWLLEKFIDKNPIKSVKSSSVNTPSSIPWNYEYKSIPLMNYALYCPYLNPWMTVSIGISL